MLEIRSHSPELPPIKLADTIVVTGAIQQTPDKKNELDEASRFTALTAGLLLNAGVAKRVILRSPTREGLTLMENYLDGIDTPKKSLISKTSTEGNDAHDLKKIVDNDDFGEVATVSAGGLDKDVLATLERSGIKPQTISPADEIGRRIVNAATGSRKALEEGLRALLNVARLRMPVDVKVTRLART